MSDQAQVQGKGNLIRGGIIGLGVVVFLLLFLADKTNLNTDEVDSLSQSSAETQVVSSQALPPLAPDEVFDQWVSELSTAEGQTKANLLDSIITHLQKRNRHAYASDYAEQWLTIDRSLPILLLSGLSSQKATQLPYVQRDSSLFRRYSDRSITHLREVIVERPSDETALLYLGVALVTSRKAENSMQGIMTLRKVLEINPDHVEANFQLGVFSLQTNQLEKAVQRFEKVLSLDPAYQPARFQLAVVRIRQQQPEIARALLEQIIQEASEPDIKLEARELLQTIS